MLKLIVLNLVLLLSAEKVFSQAKASASVSVNIITSVGGIETAEAAHYEALTYSEILVSNISERIQAVAPGKIAIGGERLAITSFTIIGDSFVYDITLPKREIQLTQKDGKGLIKTIFSTNQLSNKLGQKRIVLEAKLPAEVLQSTALYISQEPLDVVVNFN
jgi:hypothetical protein